MSSASGSGTTRRSTRNREAVRPILTRINPTGRSPRPGRFRLGFHSGPIDDEIGPMGYLPGSHRRGLRKFVNIFFGEAPDLLADPKLEGLEPVFPKVPGGAIAFHHGLTVHLAKPNRSRRMRRVHTAIFFADGSTRSARGAHPSVDRTEVRVGVPIRSDATPVAWPLEPGNLPPPPSSRVPDDAIGRHLWPDLGGGSS
ncbi:MAG: phytanoyl-CoA dioxygenase family protein [Myxococcota bacterium]